MAARPARQRKLVANVVVERRILSNGIGVLQLGTPLMLAGLRRCGGASRVLAALLSLGVAFRHRARQLLHALVKQQHGSK